MAENGRSDTRFGGGKCLVHIDSMGPLSPHPSALSLLLQEGTMKDGIANNSTASISQARKAVEQLKMEACMDRIKVRRSKGVSSS